jgi:hypothetical protein
MAYLGCSINSKQQCRVQISKCKPKLTMRRCHLTVTCWREGKTLTAADRGAPLPHMALRRQRTQGSLKCTDSKREVTRPGRRHWRQRLAVVVRWKLHSIRIWSSPFSFDFNQHQMLAGRIDVKLHSSHASVKQI